MVEVDIHPKEAQALFELMKDAKCPVEMGYILITLKMKVYEAFKKADEDQQKQAAKGILKKDAKLIKECIKEMEEETDDKKGK